MRAGGKLAVGRPSVTRAEYGVLVAHVLERANHRCERCGRRGTLDPHHVLPRSRGGADDEHNLTILCRGCHDLTAIAFQHGRLLVTPVGVGRFCFRLVQAPNKWAPSVKVAHDHTPTLAWLNAVASPVSRFTAVQLNRAILKAADLEACRCG